MLLFNSKALLIVIAVKTARCR